MADAGKFKLVLLAYVADLPDGIETDMKWGFFFLGGFVGL